MSRRKMEEELTCPICMELFQHPRRLPCGHSYCHACIRAMLDNRAEESGMYHNYFRPLICPECRDEVSVDFVQGVEGLPLDFKLSKLVELVQFMKNKDSSSSGSEEDSCSRANDVRSEPGSSQTGPSSGVVTPADNTGSRSANQSSRSPNNGWQVSPLSPLTNTDGRGESQVASAGSVTSSSVGPVGCDSLSTFLASEPPSLPIAQTESLGGDTANTAGSGGVDHTVRFDSFLSPQQDVSSPSAASLRPSTGNQIHFSLSSLPGNALGNSVHQEDLSFPHAVGESPLPRGELFRGVSSDSTRASSLPPLQTSPTPAGTVWELGVETGVQPGASASFSSLPGGAASGTVTRGIELRGGVQVHANKIKAKDKGSVSGQPPDSAVKPKSSRPRWRNLFGSSSSSSSSWSGSDLDDSDDSHDSNQDQRKRVRRNPHGKPASGAPVKSTAAAITVGTASGICSTTTACQGTDVPVANANKNKKSKKWLMTRFLRSVVFSDSSSTYGSSDDSSGSSSDEDLGARSNRNTNTSKNFVSSSAVAKAKVPNQGHTTSNSLPNIAAASNQTGAAQLAAIRTSHTSDNIICSPTNQNLTQLQSQSASEIHQARSAGKENFREPANQVGAACFKRPSVSSQTEIKEPCSSSSQLAGETNPVGGCLRTRPSVSSQTELKELSNIEAPDETSVIREQFDRNPSRAWMTSETEPKQQRDIANCFRPEQPPDVGAQNSIGLTGGDNSPRTIYDNVSPDQPTSQQFCFKDRDRPCNTRLVDPPNTCELRSRYDNYPSVAIGALGIGGNHQVPVVNMSGIHEISSLKEDTMTSRPNPVLEISPHQTSQVEPTQAQGHTDVANPSLTLYDNVGSGNANLDFNSSSPSLIVARDPGTEIEDLKTGLEQSRQHNQYPEGLQPTAQMGNVHTASLVSSVEEPSLLASGALEQEVSQAAGRIDDLRLGELTLSTEPGLRGVNSRVECDSAWPEASRYDNVISASSQQQLMKKDCQSNRDIESDVVHVGKDGCVMYSPARLPVATVGLNLCGSGSGRMAGQEVCDGFRTGASVSQIPELSQIPAGVGLSPHSEFVGSGSANTATTSSPPVGDTTVGAAIIHSIERIGRDALLPSHTDEPEVGPRENNNYKTSYNGVPSHRSGRENDECNDDADVEDDDDDEENAHSSSAMLKSKKKKPRSKFTKFLTSLLSLSSSSEDDDYVREDVDDTGTTSSKSSGW